MLISCNSFFTWWVQVADFGLSKEEVYDGRKSGLKGTYGYMDPDYMSTNKFTKKSDVYSFGIILFELITGINPQQGLMEYINLVSHFDAIECPVEIIKPSFLRVTPNGYHNLRFTSWSLTVHKYI